MFVDPLNEEFTRLHALSGWTQSKAAEKLHVDRVSIYRYMAGTVRPRLTTLELYAQMLGEDLKVKTIEPVPRVRPSERGDRRLIDWEEEALEALRKIPAVERNKLIEAIGSIGMKLQNSVAGSPSTETRVRPPVHSSAGREDVPPAVRPPAAAAPPAGGRDAAGVSSDSPLANQKISNKETLPGMDPKVAAALRATAPIAVRKILAESRRQRASQQPSPSTAAPTGGKHPPAGQSAPRSTQPSAPPPPVHTGHGSP